MGSRAGIGTGGRPVSSRYGFARPGTVGNRPGSVAGRGGTAGMRPITGRFVRLGTASLQSVPGGPHIDVQRLNMEKMAREHPMIAKLLCEYILYVEHLPKLALDLCTAALKVTEARAGSEGETESKTQMQVGIRNSEDWWWKARLGKANYQLGLLRDAEKHFKAALFEFPPHATAQERSSRFYHYDTTVVMELAKVYIKMDQPLTAMELYMTALEFNPVDHLIVLCSARLHDELHDSYKAFELYSNVLALDSSNIEAIACTAAFFFYEKNQPELALRFYRRLLQMGVQNSEVWNNIGLCGYYTCQFDFALRCLDRALSQCTTALNKADVWYNIGHVGIGLGDMTFAKRAFRLAVSADPTHGEALNNLSVLSLSSEVDKKDSSVLLHSAVSVAPELLEALYNSALQCFKNGELEESYNYVIRALDVLPDHAESINLHEKILKKFTSL
ncbi:TRP protein for flagellar function [Angomonas deanei]|uniref:Tetratricopeptide repeat, putative n=1 Tax=Angomonas deanei TaxID=59799 RepID=A0A7G2CN44_9TRYP|nr:TRP protein for flagellar function [Angomonas deanei]CAD2220497.1 Tetratricopeptide repeat, putative [Angomonas deanei]|eukprot:EPY38405.1 TRP protein for flagellar function [Angomonas deanei]